MAKRTTPTFIVELPLSVSRRDERELLVRLEHVEPEARLKLSQYDHFTEVCTKKTLNERWHVLGDGCGVVQRDLYAAFLAFTVLKDENDQQSIHPSCTAEVWPKSGRSLDGCAIATAPFRMAEK